MSWFDYINMVPDALQSTFAADDGDVVYLDPKRRTEVPLARCIVGPKHRAPRSSEMGVEQVWRMPVRLDLRDFKGFDVSPERGGHIRIGDAEFHIEELIEFGGDIEARCESVGQVEFSEQNYRRGRRS